jgi:hypothetical protein
MELMNHSVTAERNLKESIAVNVADHLDQEHNVGIMSFIIQSWHASLSPKKTVLELYVLTAKKCSSCSED